MRALRLIHAMPRCGSTLLAAHLASMKHVTLLSEVHPTLPLVGHPCDQARDWHGLLDDEEAKEWKQRLSFAEIVVRLHDRAASANRHLVMREWSYPDFKKQHTSETPPTLPTWRSSIARCCDACFNSMSRISLVREPVDQWLSFQSFNDRCRKDKRSSLDLPIIMRSYRAFAEMAATTEIVRFEDLTRDPETTLRRVCLLLDVPYVDVKDAWKTCAKVTGDPEVMKSHPSVEVLPQKTVAPNVLNELRSCDDYLATCQLLQYPPR